MKEQVLNSPFCRTEFLDLAEIVSEEKITKYKNYAISESSIVNVGNRNFVDYRPDIFIEPKVINDNNTTNISLDSLHFFQIQNLVEKIDFKTIPVSYTHLTLPTTGIV